MNAIGINDKTYTLDDQGFMLDFFEWDEQFAENMAPRYSIPTELTQQHWNTIYYIRNYYKKNGACPLVYRTCRENRIRLNDLRVLFPSGYLRGACRLAGITYAQAVHSGTGNVLPAAPCDRQSEEMPLKRDTSPRPKTYQVTAEGFLVAPDNWDEAFSTHKALELKMPTPLTDRHWQIIYFLRSRYMEKGQVPILYDTCDALKMEIDELESLFPDGYHRGAVKISGLPTL